LLLDFRTLEARVLACRTASGVVVGPSRLAGSHQWERTRLHDNVSDFGALTPRIGHVVVEQPWTASMRLITRARTRVNNRIDAVGGRATAVDPPALVRQVFGNPRAERQLDFRTFEACRRPAAQCRAGASARRGLRVQFRHQNDYE
jgi:hypothetical protein